MTSPPDEVIEAMMEAFKMEPALLGTRAAIHAAIAAAEKHGWGMRPRRPSDKMLTAGYEYTTQQFVYRAMHDAGKPDA